MFDRKIGFSSNSKVGCLKKFFEVHAQLPYTSSIFNNSDEIRIAVQNQDQCLLPCKSSLHIQGKLVKEDGTPVTNTRFIINAIYHLFEEARYELNAAHF